MRLRLALTLLFMTAVGSGALEACSLQAGGTQPMPDSSVTDAETDADLDAGDAAGQDAGVEAGQDASANADAGPRDAGPPDAACSGVRCDSQCLDAGDCQSCSGAPLLCGSTCVSSCSSCHDSQGVATPIQCFACDSNHANPIGTCQHDNPGSYCLSGDYSGQYRGGFGYRCSCNTVSACPGSTQACVPLGSSNAGFCLTCGEATVGSMQGLPCKGGGACQPAQAACQ